jgi:hypothetical protein
VLGALQPLMEDVVTATIRPDGREVIVRTQDGALKAIALTPAAQTTKVGATTVLFKLPSEISAATIHPAGTEFIVEESPFAAGQSLRVLTHWDVRLKR